VVAVVAALLAGCADFSGSEAAPFTGLPSASKSKAAAPDGPPVPSGPPKAPGPCIDADYSVLATCLTGPTDLITTDGFEHAYVAERGGTVMYTTTDLPSREVLRIGVDTAGDGGLTALVLSPNYSQDRLFYAYVSTPTDNRVVRVTPGDEPKVILSGIPKGPSGNVGSLHFWGDDLIVATGDAGDAAAAGNPASLAGKVLLLRSPSTIAPARPEVLASGGGRQTICSDLFLRTGLDNYAFIADQRATQDRLRVINLKSRVVSDVWTWPERPGLAGCAVTLTSIYVSESRAGRVELLQRSDDDAISTKGEPRTLVERTQYGVFGRLAIGPRMLAQGVTTNKPAPQAPTDDRVVLLPGGGGDSADSGDD